MKRHPVIGYELLKALPGISPEILDGVRHHHEYLDGSGYPDALTAPEISDLVRLLTISDIFAALIESEAVPAGDVPAGCLQDPVRHGWKAGTIAREGVPERGAEGMKHGNEVDYGDTLAMVAAASPDAVRNMGTAVDGGLPQRDVQILKQVTDLFLSNVERLRESQISAFDELLVPLIDRTEAGALVHLSEALSTIDLAPGKTIRKLAFHNDALAAAPVLRNSSRLSESDLIEIAKTHSQQHLLAICRQKDPQRSR